jgi:hypothetical protein
MRSGRVASVYPESSEASGYSFGTDHAILSGRYRVTTPRVSRARAFGPASLFDERFDLQDIDDVGERIDQVLDLSLTTTTLAGNRASYMIRAADIDQEGDVVLVPLQPGLEVWDCVDVTDSGAGLASAKRRVLGLRFRHRSAPRGVAFEVEMRLGAA